MNQVPRSLSSSTRRLSTSARVHPAYLPYISNPTRGRGLKWVPPLAGLVAVGYGVVTYREAQIDRHLVVAERVDAERRRKNMALADAYGDRTSLEELEHAMRVYEA